MRITNSEVIKSGEQDLIDAITADLDWGAIENIFREQHNLGIDEDVEYKQGDIVVHENQIAYQLQFEVKVTVSVLLDREGNYLSVAVSENNQEVLQDKIDESPQLNDNECSQEKALETDKEDSDQKISRIASEVGEIMEEMEQDMAMEADEGRA